MVGRGIQDSVGMYYKFSVLIEVSGPLMADQSPKALASDLVLVCKERL